MRSEGLLLVVGLMKPKVRRSLSSTGAEPNLREIFQQRPTSTGRSVWVALSSEAGQERLEGRPCWTV